MRSTFDVNFYCSPSKANKKTGMAPVYISIIINGKRELFPLPQKYNEYLKEIANLCEIVDENGEIKNLTTHTARHTFVVFLINKHISPEVIGKMCGWSEGDVRRMLKVYGKVLDQTVFEETAQLDTEGDKLGRKIMERLTGLE